MRSCLRGEGLSEFGAGKLAKAEGELLFQLESYRGNPIVKPRELGVTWIEDGEVKVGAVFNGGAELHDGRVVLLPRCHKHYRKGTYFDRELGIERVYMEDYVSEVWVLESSDFISFSRVDNITIRGDGSEHRDFTYGIEDIRVVRSHVGEYLLVGCGKVKPPFKEKGGDRIAVYTTRDFRKIEYRGCVTEFDSRNAVPFPEPIDDKLYMLFRFHPNIHIDMLEAGIDQLLSPREYRELWREIYRRRDRSILIKAGTLKHEREKVGAGPQLIKTKEGWLMIYHAVGEISRELYRAYGLNISVPRGYSVCAALLDLDDPRKIIAKTTKPIYIPSHPWELQGDRNHPVDVPNVVFPVGAIVRNDTLLLYCGAGDKYEVLLTCKLSMLLDYLLKYCLSKT
ncbi:MAG: hypothetical protein DRN96_04610 [Thermoproteota archaeon]|nr:MAG: hypothetical protein DRN96_04610 [Candidatus Korarchaeota archaeon]